MRHAPAVVLALAAATSSALATGCVPFGCGGVDPTATNQYQATETGTVAAPGVIDGLVQGADGVWLLERGDASHVVLIEQATLGGAELRRLVVTLDAPGLASGVAWDGQALWIGEIDTARGTFEAVRIDATTGAPLARIATAESAMDLAWDGQRLLAAQADPAYEAYDPATGKLAASVPVRQLGTVTSLAHTGGEVWVAEGGSSAALVYDETGTLIATASVPAIQRAGAEQPPHLAFIGDELVVADGMTLHRFAIVRPATL